MRKNKILSIAAIAVTLAALLFAQARNAAASNLLMMMVPILSAANNSTTIEEKVPSLALMAAKDTDKVEMAWVPGSDGKTPVNQIQYEIHLSVDENFTPGPATLKKTVSNVSQTEVDGLAIDTIYYGKIIARYSNSSSDPSNQLETKTFKNPAQLDNSAVVATAEGLGLGKHTTTDGITYSYKGGTPPEVGSILFSEDAAGTTNIRKVDSVSVPGDGTVTVQTSKASLTDALDVGSFYTSVQLFDVPSQAENLPLSNQKIAVAESLADTDGSQHSSITWKNNLLSVEQVNYAYNKEEFFATHQGDESEITVSSEVSVCKAEHSQYFTATVTPVFTPKVVASAEWGNSFFKKLDSAKIVARGTLSLTALAKYNFSAEGCVEKEWKIWEKTLKHRHVLVVGGLPIPIFQEITLSMHAKAKASALGEINAMAQATISETVEVGAIYDGSKWESYIKPPEKSNQLTASLDIKGKANAEIRLIPKINVMYYSVLGSSTSGQTNLSVEPFISSGLNTSNTTDNLDFRMANPLRWMQLTAFDASLGMDVNIGVSLNFLDSSWEILPSTCVKGTSENCLIPFDPYKIFSIPEMVLVEQGPTGGTTKHFNLVVTDGAHNKFDSNSIRWEVYPSYASVAPRSCSRTENVTRCKASLYWPYSEEYTIFASGHGVLGEPARQFRELKQLPYSCTYSTEEGYPSGIAYRVDCSGSLPDGKSFSTTRIEEKSGVQSIKRTYNTEDILESDVQLNCVDDDYYDYLPGVKDFRCHVYKGEDTDGTGSFDLDSYSTDYPHYDYNSQCEDYSLGNCPYSYRLSLVKNEEDQNPIYTGCFEEDKRITQEDGSYYCEYDVTKAPAIDARVRIHNEYLFNLVGEDIANDVKNGEGSCHDWWDHYDENGVWQECGF